LTGIKSEHARWRTVDCVSTGSNQTARRPHDDRVLLASRILALFDLADQLHGEEAAPASMGRLHGKNIALLRRESDGVRCPQLRRAAEELGARVAELEFAEPSGAGSASHDIHALGRLLGRLYDAIDCADLAPGTVRAIEQSAGVPVFCGLGLEDNPARALADLWNIYRRQPPVVDVPRRIIFVGGDHAMRARTFLAAARDLGFEVQTASQTPPSSAATAAIADASTPDHWVLRTGSHLIDEETTLESHRRLMQALLVDTLIKP
jgi:ornithine carbamoyltransferase